MNHDHPVVKKMLEGWALSVALILVFYAGYGIGAYEREVEVGAAQTAASYNAVFRLMGAGTPATTTATSTGPATTTPTATTTKVMSQTILSVKTDKNEYPRNADVNVEWKTKVAPEKGMIAELIDMKGGSVVQFERIDSKTNSGSFGFVLDPKKTDEDVFRIRIKDIASGVTAISNKFLMTAQSLVSTRAIGKPTFYYQYEGSTSGPEVVTVTYKVNFTNNDSVPVYFSKVYKDFVSTKISRSSNEGGMKVFNPADFKGGFVSVRHECEGDTLYSTKFDVLKPGKTMTCYISVAAAGSQLTMNGHYFMRLAVEGFNFQKSMTSVSPVIVVKPTAPMTLDVTQDKVLSKTISQEKVAQAAIDRAAVEQTANSLSAAQSLLTASVLPGLSVIAEGVLAMLKK